jgi:hypothetical protein
LPTSGETLLEDHAAGEPLQHVLHRYLDGLGLTAIVRRIEGGIIVESRDQAQAREELRALVERIRAAAKSDAPSDAEIGAIVDGARTERARRR